jgi:aspartyl-tRNA(Asn)/glutamyl-tRNA(Gln) amidotransferase subunit B
MAAAYEAIIGLEVHAQLKTASKMFCACASNAAGAAPNTDICPVCTGHPGTLPVVNRAAVEMAIKVGLALGCAIQDRSVFARKNYFYPDLPKGYQISQYEFPLCLGGGLDITADAGRKHISLIRIHLEEDAGKLLHDFGHPSKSHVDFNRCGVPLIEIVSGPDMRTPKEAGDYLRTLRNVLVYLDVCEGNLQEGNFRCDANISLRPVGQEAFGTRTEMKNLNSFKAVERALAFEIERQAQVLGQGGTVIQETRLWNDAAGKTESMRSKEEAHDYRYFPDPDLLPLIVGKEWIEELRKDLPELANEKRARFQSQYGLTEYEASVIAYDKFRAAFFEFTVKAGTDPKQAANWILGDLMYLLNERGLEFSDCPISPQHLSALIASKTEGAVSGSMAKDVLAEMFTTGKHPHEIIKEKGFVQVSDSGALEPIVDQIIADNPKQVAQYRAGKAALLAFFVGQAMKATKGQANPQMLNEILKKKLG